MTTYAAMRQNFITLLNRTDCADPNAALVKGWFDNSIQRIQREVRAPHMERDYNVDTSVDVSSIAVPADWVETKAFVWDDGTTDSGEIDKVDLGTYYRRKNESFGTPTIYTRLLGNFIIADPIPAGTTSLLIYYGEEQPLVNDDDETTLSMIASDLIVYGALTYAGDYFIDDRKGDWESKWQFFREQIQSQAAEGENRGSISIQPIAEYDDGV